jgi:hypothetical protein
MALLCGTRSLSASRPLPNSHVPTVELGEAFAIERLLDEAGDRIRTGDVQLGKLTFYH